MSWEVLYMFIMIISYKSRFVRKKIFQIRWHIKNGFSSGAFLPRIGIWIACSKIDQFNTSKEDLTSSLKKLKINSSIPIENPFFRIPSTTIHLLIILLLIYSGNIIRSGIFYTYLHTTHIIY